MNEYEDIDYNPKENNINLSDVKELKKNFKSILNEKEFEPSDEFNDQIKDNFEPADKPLNVCGDGQIHARNIKNNSAIDNSIKLEEYSTLDFVEDLRLELQNLVPNEILHNGRLSDAKLSEFLGQVKEHIHGQKSSMKSNSSHKINLNFIDDYKINLKSKFGEKNKDAINIINKYCNMNELKEHGRVQIYNHHPNININYFSKIDSKEKAYWLGFFFADGWIYKTSRGCYQVGFNLQRSDKEQIINFTEAIGLNKEKIKFRTIEKEYKGEIRKYEEVVYRFTSNKIANDLKKQGFKGSKFKATEFPELNNRDLDLAFLLGFYDGEGDQGRTRISSSSKKILDQIQKKFSLSLKVRRHKAVWQLSLGGKLMNEMQNNYKNSLQRKRKFFQERSYDN